MFLSVQQAARRLGVSPVTVRRWTASGFLPCTRTAGGHRRIDEHDIDDLARAIGDSNHLAAQAARERELDVLVSTSIALASRLDLAELLAEIAKRMTSMLNCHFCAISIYDRAADAVSTLAEYDHSGRRLPDQAPYPLAEFPLTRKVLTEQTTSVINVDDPAADPAEVAVMRRDGDRSLLMAPLVYRGETIGLLEVVDQTRPRSYSRQELRLCGAIAGQAAAALHNATLFAERRRSDHDLARLREGLGALSTHVGPVLASSEPAALLEAVARATCDALRAVSCVASHDGLTAGASGGARGGGARAESDAALAVVHDPSGDSDLTLVVTLEEPPGEGQIELLTLLCTAAAALARRLEVQGERPSPGRPRP
jgi:excisionase family DNA binding protein